MQAVEESAAMRRGFTVLVVDDEPESRQLIRIALELDGCTVLEATGGMEAIRKARRTAPDVIVTDLRMPGISGIETARLLAGLPGTRGIPRIAVTVEPPDHVSDQLLTDLFVDVILKPFAPARLRATVRDAAGA
jgi:two-component system chemotaxis response regulator CheY